ncbi:MAG TPA: TenA family protein [Acidisoma sp.]|uniref:TenA family protein n=1 Tax=Acidisoma sp. TaxID=1872115 RepID=UPI002CBD5BB0|nr:TenA family protein [Acidisoma sp.]HTI03204.1 TenA family protein [Acidisoma sp.]
MTPTGVSARLRAENIDVWEAMQTHRFVTEIEQDRLPADVLARYFIFEHSFVETAVTIFGHALLKAPAFAQRRRLIATLHALSEAQLVWFQDCFAGLGLVETNQPMPSAVQDFARGMQRIAEDGTYPDIVTIMLAAEWMYGTWCSRANQHPSREPWLEAWVRLHAEPEFLNGAAWLRAEVDREGAAMDEDGRARLSMLFRRALELEIDFHSAAYDSSWPVPRSEETA